MAAGLAAPHTKCGIGTHTWCTRISILEAQNMGSIAATCSERFQNTNIGGNKDHT